MSPTVIGGVVLIILILACIAATPGIFGKALTLIGSIGGLMVTGSGLFQVLWAWIKDMGSALPTSLPTIAGVGAVGLFLAVVCVLIGKEKRLFVVLGAVLGGILASFTIGQFVYARIVDSGATETVSMHEHVMTALSFIS